nr:Ankyrin [Echinococcus granulosus]
MHGSVQAVYTILNYGASLTAADRYGNTALHWAAVAGSIYCAHILLQHGIDINRLNYMNATPLMNAISFQNIDVAIYLLWNGASTTPELNVYEESALTCASSTGDVAIVELILAVEVPVEHRIRDLYASLGQAAVGGHMEVVQFLLDNGAPVDLPNTTIESPLNLAICGGDESIVRLLLSRGANTETVNRYGYTPLMEAAIRRNVNAVTALLSAGANITTVSEKTRETAYALAEEQGYFEICDILMESLDVKNL